MTDRLCTHACAYTHRHTHQKQHYKHYQNVRGTSSLSAISTDKIMAHNLSANSESNTTVIYFTYIYYTHTHTQLIGI